ncbi:MAG: hypothetical protein KTR15_12480 [Phycisphaeraceae bacterium]|nr:hypothetical protein [Phycisphaeraceae bacterium]
MKRTLLTIGLIVFTSIAHGADAQSGPGMMLVPWAGDQQAQVKADAFYTPTEADVTGADVDLSIFTSTGRFRLDPDASYNPTIGYEFVQYEIGSSDAALPDDLTDVSIAFGGGFGNVDLGETFGQWQMGYTLGLGYAGVTPFNDGDAYYGKADLFAVKAIDRDTRWLVGINYDGNRSFMPDVPLPAVTYFSRLNETTTYAIGLPFSQLTWAPDEFWTVDIRSAFFFNFNGTVSYQASEDLKLFASYTRRNDAFTLPTGFANRRLLFSQDRAEVGLSYDLGENLVLTVAGGYALNQEFDVGFDSRDPGGLRDLDDSGYIRGGIEIRF